MKILDWITEKGEYSSLVGGFHLLMLYPLSQSHRTPSIYLQGGAFSLINLSDHDLIAHRAFYLQTIIRSRPERLQKLIYPER